MVQMSFIIMYNYATAIEILTAIDILECHYIILQVLV